MRLFPNIIQGQDTATTYIEFENSSMDTLKIQYIAEENITTVTKVWYNDELMWDINSDERKLIKIVK